MIRGENEMHKSQLGGLIIDCNTDDLESAATFWSKALGMKTRPPTGSQDPIYATLETRPAKMWIEVQKVAHDSRVHLDIETDDIDAEVRRLEKLGARRIGAVKTWVVMEAPTGQRFCVVSAEHPDFQLSANSWS
jgi:predicted enzyme related to lactoylglutathione lyase